MKKIILAGLIATAAISATTASALTPKQMICIIFKQERNCY